MTDTDDAEHRLAERVKRERERRGWSYGTLAERLTAAGCPVHTSALWRVEHGERNVMVRELVAFAAVFELPVADLLLSIEEVQQQDALRIMSGLDDAEDRIETGVWQALDTWVDLHRAWGTPDADVAEFVMNQREHKALAHRASAGPIMAIRGAVAADDEPIRNALVELDKAIRATAFTAAMDEAIAVKVTARRGNSNGKH